ncbi:MAG: hypothetical protein M0004_02325 [Actinomycetota bacterium]|nr:hypothetical protein [Actinomycetota bacterium]
MNGPWLIDTTAAACYVLSRQTPLGGYCGYRTPEWGVEEPNAPDTLAALASLRLLAVEPPEVGLTAAWLQGLQDSEGGFPTLTIGWAALRALRLLRQAPARSPATWLREQTRTLRASYGDGSATVRAARHVIELLVEEQLDDGLSSVLAKEVLARSRAPMGCWARPGADLVTTADAWLLAVNAGDEEEVGGEAAPYLQSCEDSVLGLRISPTSRSSSADVLWAGCQLALGLGVRLAHPHAVGSSLTALQRANGGFAFRSGGIPTLRDTWRACAAARLLARTPAAWPASTADLDGRKDPE